jgi:NAD+ synthase
MPCHSNDQDYSDAKLIADRFSIPTKTIILDLIYDSLSNIFSFTEVELNADNVTLGNIKPRLRMITLYYFANLNNYLVIGTGNKSELMMGYFTKYGDGCVDLLPLGNLYKTEVKEIAGKLKIPGEIISKPPSAGLWENQTDEAEIGISYEDLDNILKGIEENNLAILDKEKIKAVKDKITKSEHKRKLPKIFKL